VDFHNPFPTEKSMFVGMNFRLIKREIKFIFMHQTLSSHYTIVYARMSDDSYNSDPPVGLKGPVNKVLRRR
jgi:hypothetical protein